MGDAYPELRKGREAIVKTIRAEEDRFDAVLTSGLPRLEELIDKTTASGGKAVSGQDVFRLYDSLGVPFDFAEDLASQRGLTIDRAGYDDAMEAQRDRARAGSAFGKKLSEITFPAWAKELESAGDAFVGYDATVAEAKVLDVFDSEGKQTPALSDGDAGFIALDKTPFYLEAGGQVSDAGDLTTPNASARVVGLRRIRPGWARLHAVTDVRGRIGRGDHVQARVDDSRRDATRRNHTATHLLHAALRSRLGEHVRQAGSLVAPDRLRFDFSHFAALTDDDVQAIERVVNEQIFRNTRVTTDVKNTDDAIKAGAMALFGEKYGDKVRVVSIEGFSQELCGGTHVRATGDIGPFVITEEAGVASGVRRIEALTGAGAVARMQEQRAALDRTSAALNVRAEQVPDAIAKLQAEAKRLSRENDQLKMKAALGGHSRGGDDGEIVSVGDAKFTARRVSGLEKDALRGLSDSLRDRLGRGVVVLAAEHDGKVSLLVSVTKDLTDRVKAGPLVKVLAPIVGGGGGGRPDFAEAGGKDASKIDEMLAKARELITAALS